MPPQAGEMKFVIETDEKGSIKTVKTLTGETKNLKKESKEATDVYGKLIKKIAAGATVLAVARNGYEFVTESIGLASDALESHDKLNVVFAGQLDKVSDAVKNLNDNYGFSVTAAEKLMGNTGDLLAGLGFQDKVVFDLSEKVQKLAGDTASFSNVQGGAEFASRALTSMLLGEKEMAKQLGIVINENDKSFKSQVKTLVEVEGMTLVQAKALVRLQEAYKQSKNSIGNFAMTQESFANQTKIVNNQIEDLKVEIGKTFVKMLLPFLRDFSAWIKENKDSIISFFDGLATGIKAVADAFHTASNFGKNFMEAISDLGDGQEELTVNTKQSEEAFKGWMETNGMNVDGTKLLTNEEKKLTGEIKKQTIAITEAEKIARLYNVSAAAGTVILEALYPEKAKIKDLQKKLNSSYEEAARVYRTVNDLEAKRKANLKMMEKPLADNLDLNVDLSESIQGVLDSMDELEKKQSELAAGFEIEYNRTISNMSLETAGAVDDLSFLGKALDRVRKIDMKSYFDAISRALDILGDVMGETSAAFGHFSGIAKSLASGDYLGAIASGLSFIASGLGKDGITGQAEAAEKALYELGVTGEEAIKKLADAYEELLLSMSMKDLMDMTADDWENLFNDMEDMAKDVARDTAEWWEPMKDAIKPLEDFLAVPAKNAEDFNAQAGITLDVFTGLLKSGMRITEALREMDGPFEKLIASQEELGLKGNKAFEELKKFRSLIKENDALVKSVEGLNSVLELTASRSALSQESADNYMKSLATKSAELEKAGFNQNQIYELLAPSLKTLAEQADKYGLKLDDNTKRMIEQAEAGGHFDAIADPMDRVADILEKIFVQLGGNVDELGKMEIAADETARKTAEGFDHASAAIYGVGDAAANTADMMASNFKRATDLSGEQIDLLVKSSINKLSKLGDVPGLGLIPANEGPQPAPLAIPRFANGTPPGGLIVPPGYDDNYFIGLKSGERFTVDNGRNQTQTPPVVIERLYVTVVAAPGDSVEELSNKFIQALRNDTIGLVREMNRAGVGRNGQ